jgi:hypothetical protein
MISVPATSRIDQTLLYHDSADRQMLYLDVLRPAPVHGADIVRWQPISPDAAYLIGEVRFGPAAEDFQNLTGTPPGMRVLPMPWLSSPVYVWSRDGDGVRRLATGKTSGFGLSNAIFNATAPARAMIEPVQVAAELVCQARPSADMRGGGMISGIGDALARAQVGERADWSATVGAALCAMLRQQLDAGNLTLVIQPGDLAAPAVAELREFALLEWAHRIAAAQSPAIESLALPAAQIARLQLPAALDLLIEWSSEAIVPVRALRSTQP